VESTGSAEGKMAGICDGGDELKLRSSRLLCYYLHLQGEDRGSKAFQNIVSYCNNTWHQNSEDHGLIFSAVTNSNLTWGLISGLP
jgi:hypothetical protein